MLITNESSNKSFSDKRFIAFLNIIPALTKPINAHNQGLKSANAKISAFASISKSCKFSLSIIVFNLFAYVVEFPA